MREPTFIGREVLDELHRESIRQFGGTMGVRDDGLAESALASAENAYFYANGDFYDIAASFFGWEQKDGYCGCLGFSRS